MKIMTWGVGGSYATLKAAWDAAVWDDDILFQQTGTASNSVNLTYKNQNGYTAIVKGNGEACTIGSFLFTTSGTPNGDLILEDLVCSSYGLYYFTFSGIVQSLYKFIVRRCEITLTGEDGCVLYNMSSGYKEIEIYTNVFYNNFSPVFARGVLAFRMSDLPLGYRISVEDNFIITNGSGNRYGFEITATSYSGDAIMRRNYIKDAPSNHAFLGNASAFSNSTTDTYCSFLESSVTTTHDDIAFSTDNFISTGTEDPLYGVPKFGSPVYDDATQVSEIAENISGLNGIPIGPNSHRAAGPYTPPILVNPPTGVLAEYTGIGVKITWTDSATNDPGYESVYIYYETVSAESAFTIPKDSVVGGTQTYTISYVELSSAPVWYVRLQHGA